jgi:hypothetical protein
MIREYVRNGVELFVAQQPALFRAKAPAAAVSKTPVDAAAATSQADGVSGSVTAAALASGKPHSVGSETSVSPSVGEEEEEDDVAALGRSTNSVESLLLASVAAEDDEIFTAEVHAAMVAAQAHSPTAGSAAAAAAGGNNTNPSLDDGALSPPTASIATAPPRAQLAADSVYDGASFDDDDEDEYDQYDRTVNAERERRAMAEVAEVCGAVQGHKSVDQMRSSRSRIRAGAAAGATTADHLAMSSTLGSTVTRRRNRRFARALRTELRQRLEIYATALPRIRALIFSDFRETCDIEEALVASCCITPLAGLPFRTRRTGVWVCDGGLAAFQPRAGHNNVITISALYFTGADVCPSEVVPAWWGLYPPGDAEYRDLFDLGHNDALRLLQSKGLISAAAAEAAVRPRTHKLRPRGVTGLVADTFAAIAYFVLRAFAMCLVYGELAVVASVCLGVTVFHTWFPNAFEALLLTSRSYRRNEGGRFAALKDYFALAFQFANARVLLHLAFGRRLDSAASGLERYSRIYRVVKPLMG